MSVTLMSAVFKNEVLPPIPRLLMLALSDEANEQGRPCWLGVKSLSKRVSVHPRTLQRYLSQLRDSGYITIDYKASNLSTNCYYVNLDAITANTPLLPFSKYTSEHGGDMPVVAIRRGGGDTEATGGGGAVPGGGDTSATQPISNPLDISIRDPLEKESAREKTLFEESPKQPAFLFVKYTPARGPVEILQTFEELFPPEFQDEAIHVAWRDWIVMRRTKGRKKIVKERAAKLGITELKQIAQDPALVIKQSVDREWDSFYRLKDLTPKTNSGQTYSNQFNGPRSTVRRPTYDNARAIASLVRPRGDSQGT